MSYTHEFGVLDSTNRQSSYDTYTPEHFDCVSVDGEWVDEFIEELNEMRTYFHSYDRPGFGLDECGITLIPHESLALFYQVVKAMMYTHESEQLNRLISKITQAQVDKKDMIHFGL